MNGYKKRMFQTNEKNYSHKFFVNKNICDDKVENREKTCFKTSGANGVLDILLVGWLDLAVNCLIGNFYTPFITQSNPIQLLFTFHYNSRN